MLFSQVIGHSDLKGRLIQKVAGKRTGHAMLLLGPEDSGALALGLGFARYVLCRDRGAEDACGKCPSCLKLDKLAHPDLHFFFPTAPNQEHKMNASSRLFMKSWREALLSNPYISWTDWLEQMGIENKQAIINTEDCNDIIRVLGMKSYESPYRIIFIYMLEKLYHAAAPKLLKVLEEPPGNTLFIMVSENKDRIINTILSRTHITRVPLPSEKDVYLGLKEKFGLDDKKAQQISFITGGSVTEALKLCRNDEDLLADFDTFREWMRACFKNDTGMILKWIENTVRSGRENQKAFFQYGLKIFRMCLYHNYNTTGLIRLEDEEREFIGKFAPFVNHRNILRIVEEFNQAIMHLERNANSRILFADLSFRLHALMHEKTS